MVGTKSALEAIDSQEDLVVSRSKLGKVFCSEGSGRIPIQQGLNHLGLQHSNFRTKRGGQSLIQIRAEPFEACPHETDPSVRFEREDSVFVGNAAQV